MLNAINFAQKLQSVGVRSKVAQTHAEELYLIIDSKLVSRNDLSKELSIIVGKIAESECRNTTKIDGLRDELNYKIESTASSLDRKIDSTAAALNHKIESTAATLERKIDAVEHRSSHRMDVMEMKLQGFIVKTAIATVGILSSLQTILHFFG
jgi:hypothetical protein